ncbi:cytidylate kinase-like family protein [Anaerovorax odorimutans]|uniref:cytidylate kinase-like family protein n=1 Tax=Anaerovorax odorimutans TaxID=109327 RepID=UPI000425FB91|nr:cytidylate kinase-like family protein [Anaerovorax odorimutans]
MNSKIIITIARQFGSGGREIGKNLANELNIAFYDKDLIKIAAEESGIHEELFENVDENHKNSFWDNMAYNTTSFGNPFSSGSDIPINDKLFIIQSNVIKELAEKDSCVIVGRCADYILKSNPNAIHIFIHSNKEDKINRIINSYGIPAENAEVLMIKTDKKRATYHNYYSSGKWGKAENYNLAIDSNVLGISGTVEIIKKFAQIKFNLSL